MSGFGPKMLRRIFRKRENRIVEGTKLIVGLGNPGAEHSRNRHNVGFLVLDRLADRHKLRFDRLEFQGRLAHGTVEGRPVILLKPLSYMNRSGSVVKPVLSRYKVRLEDLLIIHDDLDLQLGKIRIRAAGGSAGHRGMESVITSLRTDVVTRIRIGIGRPHGDPPEEFVLQDFSPHESITMDETYEQALAAVECFVREGIDATMNTYN
jgi:PTH1 family peptidyl-tRNA hydrolase